MEVRVVNEEWIVLKDMFNALGRVKENGGWTNSKDTLKKFLIDIDKECDYQLLVVTSKTKNIKSRDMQEVDCLKLETVPIILTQFRPINSNKRSKEQNEEALNTWRKFMKFIDNLLIELEVHKFIITDKEVQKDETERLVEADGKPLLFNNQVNIIMAKLIGVYDKGIKKLSKDELKVYQPQTVVDLLEVREYVSDKFVNAYEFTHSHKESAEMAEKLARIKYPNASIT